MSSNCLIYTLLPLNMMGLHEDGGRGRREEQRSRRRGERAGRHAESLSRSKLDFDPIKSSAAL
jgi:hypothetical protein